MTDTRGDVLKVVGLPLKVATGDTPSALCIPCRRVWSGTGAQATLSPSRPFGIKNPITSPADTVMSVRTSDIVPPPL